MVFALSEHGEQKFLVLSQLLDAIFVLLAFGQEVLDCFIPEWLALKDFINDRLGVVKLLLSTFWEGERFHHLIEMFSEFGSWPTLSCKTENPVSLDGLVLLTLVGRIMLSQPIEVVHKVNRLASLLVFDQRIWLVPGELIVG